MSERATRFMRENTFNTNLVMHGNVQQDGRIRYRMQDGAIFRLTEADVACLDRFQFKPRYHPSADGGDKNEPATHD